MAFASRTGLSPSVESLSRDFRSRLFWYVAVLLPRFCLDKSGLGSSAFARHYLRNHMLFSSPGGSGMFQFPPFAPYNMVTGLQPAGLPHSDVRGSRVICTSPRLFAAYHVLPRLL